MENIKEINIKEAEEAFENIDIKFKNQDGTYRNCLDIFEDLANLWREITRCRTWKYLHNFKHNIRNEFKKGGDANNEDYN